MVLTPDKHSKKPPPLESVAVPKLKGRKKLTIWIAGVVAIACVGLATVYVITQKETPKVIPTPTPSLAEQTKVTALGRLEPKGEVIKLSVANAQDSRVDKLLVNEGDKVKAGQVIAILQGMDKKQAALAEAKQYLAVQQAKLAQLKAGEAKTAEIAAQEANIARIEAQLRTQTAEKQAAIARALVSEPQLLLADEPTAALDSKSGRDVVEIMQQLAQEQASTILLVTHDNRILDIADRILHMEDGRLATDTALRA
ncbi:hypothetical protein [Chlorogloeopsis sp. ULAP02]|uniref:hypothetical protein n=1 Tax=Chlorogloeopsis sp. ULAP02 TaxID=3107926 RepID=UPI003136E3D7